MPFITHNERVDIAEGKPPITVGQLCYIAYKTMVQEWSKNPRWTTAHKIFRSTEKDNWFEGYIIDFGKFDWVDLDLAVKLAWQVFFVKHIMPYEDEKERENGTI